MMQRASTAYGCSVWHPDEPLAFVNEQHRVPRMIAMAPLPFGERPPVQNVLCEKEGRRLFTSKLALKHGCTGMLQALD